MKRRYYWFGVPLALVILTALTLVIANQTTMGNYLIKGMVGHASMLFNAQSIETLVDSDHLDEPTSSKLKLINQIKEFAQTELGLPAKGYSTYVHIDHNFPGWNVYAAPRLSTEAHLWCFPLVGCIAYRGYFSEEDARDFAQKTEEQEGLDVWVSPFSGYSSLGYLPDPLLSTQLRLSPTHLAGLLLHEFAHQKLYIPDSSKVNEAFSRLVEREGLKLWLKQQNQLDELARIQNLWDASEKRAGLVLATRDQLNALYTSDASTQEKQQGKEQLLLALEKQLCGPQCADLTQTTLNNAALIPYATYSEELEVMSELFVQAGGDFFCFYEVVEDHYIYEKGLSTCAYQSTE